MPFQIVQNDITQMTADAIVNTANPLPLVGSGVDAGIHRQAGRQLWLARQMIGRIRPGDAAVTPGFGLNARYVIHTVGPCWQGGGAGEEQLLASCYRRSLELAVQKDCASIAFPLICAGNNGFPGALALQIAVRELSRFLMEHDMQIWLVVFDRESVSLSEKLFASVQRFVDENYVREKTAAEYASDWYDADGEAYMPLAAARMPEPKAKARPEGRRGIFRGREDAAPPLEAPARCSFDLEAAMDFASAQELDAGFSETLLRLIDRSGKKDSEIYKRANVDRKLFSKIRTNPGYRPSKSTALAFAFALELDLNETRDLIGRAGFALTHSSKFDVIVEYFLLHGNHDVFELNEVLFAFDQPLVGS